jgi:hypothetical protein
MRFDRDAHITRICSLVPADAARLQVLEFLLGVSIVKRGQHQILVENVSRAAI